MNIVEFNKLIEPLEEITQPLNTERNIYFNRLRKFAPHEIGLAVDYLLDTYRFSRFPKPALFIKIIMQARDKEAQMTAEDLARQEGRICEKCHGGFIGEYYQPRGMKPNYFKAVYCDCPLGQKLKESHRRHFTKSRVEVNDINVKTDFDDVPF